VPENLLALAMAHEPCAASPELDDCTFPFRQKMAHHLAHERSGPSKGIVFPDCDATPAKPAKRQAGGIKGQWPLVVRGPLEAPSGMQSSVAYMAFGRCFSGRRSEVATAVGKKRASEREPSESRRPSNLRTFSCFCAARARKESRRPQQAADGNEGSRPSSEQSCNGPELGDTRAGNGLNVN